MWMLITGTGKFVLDLNTLEWREWAWVVPLTMFDCSVDHPFIVFNWRCLLKMKKMKIEIILYLT